MPKHFSYLLLLVSILVKQFEQGSAEGMSLSCCWHSVMCHCCSRPHQSLTSVSVQHGRPPFASLLILTLSPFLSFPIISLPPSILRFSPYSHTWKPAWLMSVRGTSFTVRTGAERTERGAFQISPVNTHTHTHTHKRLHSTSTIFYILASFTVFLSLFYHLSEQESPLCSKQTHTPITHIAQQCTYDLFHQTASFL